MKDYNIEITDNTNDGEDINTGFMYKFKISPTEDISALGFGDLNVKIRSWCKENLPYGEYYIDGSKMMGHTGTIFVYTHTYETSMAFKLVWD